jgi:hypothetical protein
MGWRDYGDVRPADMEPNAFRVHRAAQSAAVTFSISPRTCCTACAVPTLRSERAHPVKPYFGENDALEAPGSATESIRDATLCWTQ